MRVGAGYPAVKDVSDDHDAQEAVFRDFDPDRNDASDIRHSLTENLFRVSMES